MAFIGLGCSTNAAPFHPARKVQNKSAVHQFRRGQVSRQRIQILIMVAAMVSVAMTGCSNSKKASSAGVQFVAPTSSPSIDQGQTVNLSVSVGDGTPVTWSLQVGFGKPAGTLTNQTGTSVTYNAPPTVSSETQVTVVATAGVNSAAMAVFVEPALQITGTSFTLPATCPPAGSVMLPVLPTLSVGQFLKPGDLDVLQSGGVPPYTWTVTSGAPPAGISFGGGNDPNKNAFEGLITGAPVSPGCSTFTVQVTDSTSAKPVSLALNLVVVPASLKPSLPNIANAYIQQNNAGVPYAPTTFIGAGGAPPYTWMEAGTGPAGLPPGLTISSAGVVTGVPSPSGLVQNGGFGSFGPQFLVTDSQTPYPATAQPTISMAVLNEDSSCESGSESNLKAQGWYAFLLRGFDANGGVTIAGNFQVDGAGGITAGAEDITRTTGVQSNLSILSGSTYTLGRNNRGCITLTNSAATTSTFRFAAGGCSNGRNSTGTGCQPPASGSAYLTTGHMMEFDDSTGTGTRASGIVRLQDPAAFQNSGISGQYAFGLSGWDAAKGRFAMAGSASASSGTWSAVAADTNDAGTLSSNLTGGSGSYNVGAGGRGTGTLSVGTLSLNIVLYPVSSNEMLLATASPITSTNPLLSGEAITTTGPFNMASLQNTHIFHIAGLSTTGPDPSVGIFAFDGIGGMSGTEYENQAGTLAATSVSGIYLVDSTTGRLTFSAAQGQTLGAHPLVGYIIPAPSTLNANSCNTPAACVTGFLISTDATAQAGLLEFQTSATAPPPPFTISSLIGSFDLGTDEALDAKTPHSVGRISASPGSSTLGTILEDSSYGDTNYCLEASCLLLIPNGLAGGKYSVGSNGSGTFGGQTASVTNGAVTFFIDESPMDSHPSVMVVEE